MVHVNMIGAVQWFDSGVIMFLYLTVFKSIDRPAHSSRLEHVIEEIKNIFHLS